VCVCVFGRGCGRNDGEESESEEEAVDRVSECQNPPSVREQQQDTA
jgi:hypothetical protein